jgi:hypothetical protein
VPHVLGFEDREIDEVLVWENRQVGTHLPK